MNKPFLISEFKTGLFSYLEPWVSPKDSLRESKNVFVSRGCIVSRSGLDLIDHRFFYKRFSTTSNIFSTTLPDIIPNSIEVFSSNFLYKQNSKGSFYKADGNEILQISFDPSSSDLSITFPSNSSRSFFVSYCVLGSPIRAIIPFLDQESLKYGYLLADDSGLCLFVNGARKPDLLVDQLGLLFSQGVRSGSITIPWDFDPSSLVVTVNISGVPQSFSYNNGFSPSGHVQALSFNPGNKVLSFTLSVDPKPGDSLRFSLFPDQIFTGTGSVISWDSSRNYIAITNGADPILFFDIATNTISRPALPITNQALLSGTNQIKTAKYLRFYKNRLLLLDVEVVNAGGQNGFWRQSVRWSSLFLDQNSIYSHWNFVSDKPYGGEYSPDTNSQVVSCGVVKDKLVLWYTRDVYIMSPTGSPQSPFVFHKISNSKVAKCPYSSTDLDSTTQMFGNKGYLESDGVSVSRFDFKIPDFYKTIDFSQFDKIMSFRFSGDETRIATVFPSYDSPNGECDRMLIFNLIDESFAEFSWDEPTVSCLGHIYSAQVDIWESMKDRTLEQAKKFTFSSFSPFVDEDLHVAGGMHGELYALRGVSDWNSSLKKKEPISWSFKTTDFSPFLEEALMSYVSCIDIYFVGDGLPMYVILDVFVNGSEAPCKSQPFVLEAPRGQFSFRRVHVQVAASFISFALRNDPSVPSFSSLKISGYSFFARPGGQNKNLRAISQ